MRASGQVETKESTLQRRSETVLHGAPDLAHRAAEQLQGAGLAGKPAPQPVTKHFVPDAWALEMERKEVLKNPDINARKAYFDKFNQHYAPLLTTEESALERLSMKHAYVLIPDGQAFHFYISQDLRKQACAHYAPKMHVAEQLIDRENGLKAHLLVPSEPTSDKRSIMLFTGTDPLKVMDVLAAEADHPTGLKPDFDRQGIGFKAFSHNREALMTMVNRELDAGRDVVAAGHSLGGAYATRLVAAFDPDTQARVHLITFNAPGLDAKTVDQIHPDTDVRLIRMRNDLVTKAGRKHPTGVVFKLDRQTLSFLKRGLNHSTAALSAREIDRRDLQPLETSSKDSDTKFFIELLRRHVRLLWRAPA